jgi:hypothetical protein
VSEARNPRLGSCRYVSLFRKEGFTMLLENKVAAIYGAGGAMMD